MQLGFVMFRSGLDVIFSWHPELWIIRFRSVTVVGLIEWCLISVDSQYGLMLLMGMTGLICNAKGYTALSIPESSMNSGIESIGKSVIVI